MLYKYVILLTIINPYTLSKENMMSLPQYEKKLKVAFVLPRWESSPFLVNSCGTSCPDWLLALTAYGNHPGISLSLFFFLFIGVWLTYNVVLVSGVQKSESVIHVHISILLPYRLLLSTELSCLCYTVG